MNTDKGKGKRFSTEDTEERRRKIWERQRRLPRRRRGHGENLGAQPGMAVPDAL